MDSLDPLGTIAEVGIAFAGFASIVSVLGTQNRIGKIPIFYRTTVRGMLLCSLTVVIAALAPYVFVRFGEGADVWSRSAIFFAITLVGLNAAGIADGRAIAHLTPWYGRAFGGVMLMTPLVLMLLTIFGVPQGYGASFYVLALWLVLIVAAYLFASLVLVLITRPSLNRDDAPPK